ncbi:hypothetical protein PsorP6_018001 [Peronosclerospora sorghi]|uniref:Uncharacterized protein n=1 Tax=Peronosclerospora sorghi TaxID=230839 RepID=A0ACC0WEI6_9STRA|nr:hypothetical protein PsorP6_018001 [Peronosclerospora sorghi]
MGRSNNFSPAEIDRMLEFAASKKPRGKDEWVALTADLNIGATAKSVRTWEQIRNKFNRLRSDACATDHGHQAAKDAQKLIDETVAFLSVEQLPLPTSLARRSSLCLTPLRIPCLTRKRSGTLWPRNTQRAHVGDAVAERGRADTGASETDSPTGDPDFPETVRRAKHLRQNIEARRDAENLDGGVDRESDSDVNDRDSDRVEGSNNNPNDNSSQSNESDTVESSNRRGDCRNASQNISDIVSLSGDEADAFATNSAITTTTTAITITTATAKKGKSVARAGTKRKANGYILAWQASLTYPAVGGDDNPADHTPSSSVVRRCLNMSKVMDSLKKKAEAPKSTSEASKTLATQMQSDKEPRREEAERRETLQYLREEREEKSRLEREEREDRRRQENEEREEKRRQELEDREEKRRQELEEKEEREDRRERERRDKERRESAEDRTAMMQMLGMMIHRSMNNTGAP